MPFNPQLFGGLNLTGHVTIDKIHLLRIIAVVGNLVKGFKLVLRACGSRCCAMGARWTCCARGLRADATPALRGMNHRRSAEERGGVRAGHAGPRGASPAAWAGRATCRGAPVSRRLCSASTPPSPLGTGGLPSPIGTTASAHVTSFDAKQAHG